MVLGGEEEDTKILTRKRKRFRTLNFLSERKKMKKKKKKRRNEKKKRRIKLQEKKMKQIEKRGVKKMRKKKASRRNGNLKREGYSTKFQKLKSPLIRIQKQEGIRLNFIRAINEILKT